MKEVNKNTYLHCKTEKEKKKKKRESNKFIINKNSKKMGRVVLIGLCS